MGYESHRGRSREITHVIVWLRHFAWENGLWEKSCFSHSAQSFFHCDDSASIYSHSLNKLYNIQCKCCGIKARTPGSRRSTCSFQLSNEAKAETRSLRLCGCRPRHHISLGWIWISNCQGFLLFSKSSQTGDAGQLYSPKRTLQHCRFSHIALPSCKYHTVHHASGRYTW